MKQGLYSGLIIGLAVLWSAQEAYAQDNAADKPQGVQVRKQIDTVSVTARKREEPEQRTPVTMSVITGDSLERLFVNDLSDLNNVAPNVILEPVGVFQNTAAFFVRGIGSADVDSAQDPAVGIVIDGVAMARNATSLLDMFDVESVEILRGPQGTLFGRNTVGGVVNVRSRRPSGEFGVRGRLTFGDYGRADVRLAVDVPVIEGKVAAKVAVLWQNFDGFWFNEFTQEDAGGDDLLVVRPMVQFTPSDNFDLTIIGEVQRDRGDIYPATNGSTSGQLLGRIFGLPGHDLGEGPEFVWRADAPNINRVDVWGITAEANLTTGIGTFTSVTGYREAVELAWTDLDAEAIPFFNTVRPIDHEQLTQELRLASDVTDWLDIVVGLYFFRQEFAMAQQRNQTFIPGVPSTFGFTAQTHKSYAGFFHANIKLTDNLRATVGGRYTKEKKHFTHNPLGTCPGPGPENCPPPFEIDESWDNFGPKIGLDYFFNDDVMVYASWSRGFRSGGFAGRAVSISTIGPFDEEKLDAFEIGLKSDWFDRRLRVNLALFWYEFDDLQRVIIRESTTGPGNETITDNAAAARIRGLELEITAIPFEGFTLEGSLGYLDAEYADFFADLNGDGIETDNSALELSRAPKWQLRISATYEFPLSNLGILALNLDYSYTSEFFLAVGNGDFNLREDVNLLSGSVTFRDNEERYRLSFFMKNITNELYRQSATVVGALNRIYVPGDPRHWGIELGFDF